MLAGQSQAAGADPMGTAAVGALTRLRAACRTAKERLSADTAAVISAEGAADVRFTRAELEALLAEPLAGLLDEIGDALQDNRIPADRLSAVATVGGGAAIPLVTERLSQELRAPIVTTPDPGSAAAAGAGWLAERGVPRS